MTLWFVVVIRGLGIGEGSCCWFVGWLVIMGMLSLMKLWRVVDL